MEKEVNVWDGFCCFFAVFHWFLVVVHWFLVVVHWFLVVFHWFLECQIIYFFETNPFWERRQSQLTNIFGKAEETTN